MPWTNIGLILLLVPLLVCQDEQDCDCDKVHTKPMHETCAEDQCPFEIENKNTFSVFVIGTLAGGCRVRIEENNRQCCYADIFYEERCGGETNPEDCLKLNVTETRNQNNDQGCLLEITGLDNRKSGNVTITTEFIEFENRELDKEITLILLEKAVKKYSILIILGGLLGGILIGGIGVFLFLYFRGFFEIKLTFISDTTHFLVRGSHNNYHVIAIRPRQLPSIRLGRLKYYFTRKQKFGFITNVQGGDIVLDVYELDRPQEGGYIDLWEDPCATLMDPRATGDRKPPEVRYVTNAEEKQYEVLRPRTTETYKPINMFESNTNMEEILNVIGRTPHEEADEETVIDVER